MKKLAKVIELAGALLFFLGISADATVNPMVAIPVLGGLFLKMKKQTMELFIYATATKIKRNFLIIKKL